MSERRPSMLLLFHRDGLAAPRWSCSPGRPLLLRCSRCARAAVSERESNACKNPPFASPLLSMSLPQPQGCFSGASTPTTCSLPHAGIAFVSIPTALTLFPSSCRRAPRFTPRNCWVCRDVPSPCPRTEDRVAPTMTRDAPWAFLLLLPHLTACPLPLPQATKQFLEEINKWTGQYNVSPLSWNVAVKFLMARKFDVLRAIELFHSYRETRLKEGIVKLKPHEEPLRSELLSGKFTILSVRDPSGASIALFTAKLHHPSKSVQHVVLQALFYLLDRAVESFETQRNGLVFIYDMAGSQYTNFELDLSKKILNLLKGAFPARLKKVFIVGAPMWFRVPYSIISLLLKEKLRERVQMVKMSELKEHLPRECLPEYLGGSLKLDPLSWNCRFLPQQNGHPDPLDELILVPLAAPKDNGSVHVPGPKSVTLQELLDHVNHKQKRGIYEEYEDIRRRSPAGTFVCSLAPYNQEKNRYGDVPCLDQTRVKLAKPYSRPELTDYINASFMDGYKQRNAYIGTQGPLENTYGDFWRMVWEQNVLVIVMTTRLEEGGRRKCGQYWPLEKDSQVCFGALTITNLGVENLNHYKKTILEIHSSETRERRLVSHFQYLSWPDYGVPSSAATLIDFLGAVKQQQRVAVSALGPRFKGHPGGPPVVVHCSAGIGRTGTFCALDICLSQLQDMGTLNIYQTVLRMRTQRAFSIQTPEQYYFCYTAVLEHAQREGLLLANHSRAGQEKSSPGH
ncbi:tyrosine-protein phosphatase non-receptor type 9 isoform X1 [Falco biarmicus]|uniref:tyrosine-protein phosphatase non-receptor type 9 isoform X1 n=1 Tax=Falco rusticolus TaxID=120794 RepID=UPI000FFB87FB|nr:tyrosine-protein phosphatase non-receptor type 9 isoform X1 [Falco rusticolus]XP_055571700.1 tyrosine-protein phosphatase non-receptor type 9 isoform X1 [Falco cherrug]XP_055571701.1 tyrosine-protein phosphatase non-receptor type 9 isoform X1 [Falco cherrug]XP_056201734.1 tyrosine-protein phosphatase non-receptor type 9 isoform X1 [Falco biarmicus]XP_056201736.1 tyrosine-protein phosphatase non-receptor type 9 isoform X1 [Falco biarmicus]